MSCLKDHTMVSSLTALLLPRLAVVLRVVDQFSSPYHHGQLRIDTEIARRCSNSGLVFCESVLWLATLEGNTGTAIHAHDGDKET